MPLQGNLRDFSTTQLLNLINLAGKTGTLMIFEGLRTGEKDGIGNAKMAAGAERARAAFRNGKLIAASMGEQDGNLVTVLNKAGKLSDDQTRIIRERARNTNDKALAMLLMSANYVTQRDIVSSIQQFTLDIVYNLLSLGEGPFRFEDGVLPSADRIIVPIDLENVIIEGARRIKEIERLTAHLPNLDMALKFPENMREKIKGVHLSVKEWSVIKYVDPQNTIRKIAKTNNMSELEIRRIVFGLEQAGLVLIVRPAGMPLIPQADGTRRPPPAPRPAIQETVVRKLIDRIRSL